MRAAFARKQLLQNIPSGPRLLTEIFVSAACPRIKTRQALFKKVVMLVMQQRTKPSHRKDAELRYQIRSDFFLLFPSKCSVPGSVSGVNNRQQKGEEMRRECRKRQLAATIRDINTVIKGAPSRMPSICTGSRRDIAQGTFPSCRAAYAGVLICKTKKEKKELGRQADRAAL